MTSSSTSEFDKNNKSKSAFEGLEENLDNPVELHQDPDYQELLELYQRAEFPESKKLLSTLEERYPDHPDLQEFKDDLEMKLSLKGIVSKSKRDQKRKTRKATFNLGVFGFISALIVLVVFFFTSLYIIENNRNQLSDQENAQLNSLNAQAQQLLVVGKPRSAAEILDRIRAIDPDYENLPSLTEQTYELLQLEIKYQTALSLMEENKEDEALVLFREIEAERPGLWDVSQQINKIEKANQVAAYLAEGESAYNNEVWGQVISAYENALTLDPTINDPDVTEQLVRGYLNEIIRLLEDETATIEDIERAEQYYRKAVALIPQSRTFASERQDLQEASSNLLEIKFLQIAKENLADKNQTRASISQAVSFFRRAQNINSRNTALQRDLQNAERYQIAFNNFIEMEWVAAISNLNELLSADPNYAGGNASVLLFESYYALGNQYFSASLHQDALNNFEQAEILVFENRDNLMRLFQVQTRIGDTLGRLNDYENAVSYYQFAFNVIDFQDKVSSFSSPAVQFTEANNQAANGNYEAAFNTFQDVLEEIDVVYSVTEIEVDEGICLALFASEYQSTMEAIIEANDLPRNMVVTFGQTLKVPMIAP